MTRSSFLQRLLPLAGLCGLMLAAPVHAGDTTAQQQLQRWQSQSGPGQAARGQQLFNNKHGGEWSCASCHNAPPTTAGRHASTGKTITALAPAVQPDRFTETAKVDKWFKRNCNDVFKRECSAQEKADFMAYLISLRR